MVICHSKKFKITCNRQKVSPAKFSQVFVEICGRQVAQKNLEPFQPQDPLKPLLPEGMAVCFKRFTQKKRNLWHYLVGCFNPFEKYYYSSQIGNLPQLGLRGANKTYLKPPPSYCFKHIASIHFSNMIIELLNYNILPVCSMYSMDSLPTFGLNLW